MGCVNSTHDMAMEHSMKTQERNQERTMEMLDNSSPRGVQKKQLVETRQQQRAMKMQHSPQFKKMLQNNLEMAMRMQQSPHFQKMQQQNFEMAMKMQKDPNVQRLQQQMMNQMMMANNNTNPQIMQMQMQMKMQTMQNALTPPMVDAEVMPNYFPAGGAGAAKDDASSSTPIAFAESSASYNNNPPAFNPAAGVIDIDLGLAPTSVTNQMFQELEYSPPRMGGR